MKNEPQNIVLTGFMASGKTKLGHTLAGLTGYQLLDTDAILEQNNNCSIKDIFALKGEAYFRKQELSLLKSLQQNTKKSIIVCGGGAGTDFDSFCALKKLGLVFFIDTPFEVMLERISRKTNQRPLAKSPKQLRQLYEFRKPLYLSLGQRVCTKGKDHKEIAQRVLASFNKSLQKCPSELNVNTPGGDYHIQFGDLATNLLGFIKDRGLLSHQVVFVTDENVLKSCSDRFDAIKQAVNNHHQIILPPGEGTKSFSHLKELLDKLMSFKLNRHTLIIAMGGGVVGDITGFAAAIYLRGVPFIQVPTTLLAMVDSSIGGKTGIDTKYGKNLIGAFHFPQGVLVDESFLTSLPQKEYSSGMAEVIKHAIIKDEKLFFDLCNDNISSSKMIQRAINVKKSIVQEDPTEQGIRAHLNLGHTFAHALESLSDYKLCHGYAVAIGLVLATKFSQQQGLLKTPFLHDLLMLLKRFCLPTRIPHELKIKADDVLESMKHDKKRDGQGLRLVLPIRLGQEIFFDYVEEQKLKDFLHNELKQEFL